MTKHSCVLGLIIALAYVTVAVAQHPMLDAVATAVVQKYQTSSCGQLMLKKDENLPASPGEEKASDLLRTDPQMRHEFVGMVADQVVDRLIQCGMIP